MNQPDGAAKSLFHCARILTIAVFLNIELALVATVMAGSAVPPPVIYTFGSNTDGRNGIGTDVGQTLLATPIDMTNLSGVSISQVSGGANHSLLLTENGSVYSFGANAYAGVGTNVGSTLSATPIDTTNLAGRKVVQISSGYHHSLLLTDDGSVFSFGFNGSGRTGLGIDDGFTLVATPINSVNFSGKKIAQVAAGFNHSLILAEDGTVFSFGNNADGRTGLGFTDGNTLIARPIDSTNLASKQISRLAVGGEHSLLLADDGVVFSFGWNANGRTGLGTDIGNASVATVINTVNLESRKVTRIAAGGFHSLLLTDDGDVFSFGRNSGGMTGQGTDVGNTSIATAIDETNLAGRSIIDVSAKDGFGLLLSADGNVFSFGGNIFGRTGLGISTGNTLIPTPIVGSNLAGKQVIAISAGQVHSLLIAIPEPSALVLLLLGCVLLTSPRQQRSEAARGHPSTSGLQKVTG
jgi:alpha-tubulin suppressor-like RCC1 family protein